jgi:gas vesicle protein
MRRNSWPETVSAFAVGIGVGAALGLLFAPRSGEDTRDYIVGGAQDKLDEVVGDAQDKLDDVVAKGRKWARRAEQSVDVAKERVMDAAQAGERAYREAKNTAS